MKKWTVAKTDPQKVNNITLSTDLSALLATVMCARGYDTTESLREFFDSSELSDPFMLLDMDKAVNAINEAVENGELICVWGDYDCDGVTSTAILYGYLQGLGANVTCYIPERSEGYGLNCDGIDKLCDMGVSLIVTVDNGISAADESRYILKKGMKLVVTDHHQPPSELPDALAVVDPHRLGDLSHFKDLCGAGVALKLCAALDGGYDTVLEMYADLAALGTVADVVPLKGENRAIVKLGLELIKNTENLGLLSLIDNCSLQANELTSTNLAFTVCPRINAAGRFGSPSQALSCLISEDDSEAYELATALTSLNDQRKQCEAKIYEDVLAQIDKNPSLLNERVLVVCGYGWHHGVIGIVASRLLEHFGKPTVVISYDEQIARGSARSIQGFNIFKCFDYCSELMIKYGGHECAGGLTLKTDDLPRLRTMISEYAALNHQTMPKQTLEADKLLTGTDLSPTAVMDLRRLEPCGCENKEPLFAMSGAVIKSVIPLKKGEHTKLELIYDGKFVRALLFGTKTADFRFKTGDELDIMATLSVNDYKGRRDVSIRAVDYRLHGIRQDKFFAADDAYHAFKRGEKLSEDILKKGNPTREELVYVYKLATSLNIPITVETLYELTASSINAFKLSIILDAFCDTGLLKFIPSTGVYSLIKPTQKVDIESSQTLKELRDRLD